MKLVTVFCDKVEYLSCWFSMYDYNVVLSTRIETNTSQDYVQLRDSVR